MATFTDTSSSNPGEMKGVVESTTSLQEWLRNGLNGDSVADGICLKLKQAGIKDIETLVVTDDDDLNDLCKDYLELDIPTRILFKSLIKKQRKADQLKQAKNVMVITSEEQREINKFDQKATRCKHIQNALQSYMDQIEQQSISVTSEINEKFQVIMKALQLRQKSMNEQVQKWKVRKAESIQKELSNLQKYDDELKNVRIGISKIIQNNQSVHNDSARRAKIKQIVDGLDEQYKVFVDDESALKYMQNQTTLIEVSFADKITITDIASFGLIDNNLQNETFVAPSICLQPIKINEKGKNDEGYKVQSRWNVKGFDEKQSENDIQFIVKYAESNNKSPEWIELEDNKIKKVSKNEYCVDVQKSFKYNELYKFGICSSTMTAFGMPIKIISNVVEFKEDKILIKLGQSEEIKLKIHSSDGHATYVASNILKDDNNYYCTENLTDKNWIIFVNQNGVCLAPSSIHIRNYTATCGAKAFEMFIGCVNSNEWIQCSFDGQNVLQNNSSSEFQKLNLTLTQSEMERVKQKKYRQFRFKIVESHGCGSCIAIYQLKLFGARFN